MSHDLYNFATTEKVYFKLTLSGVAVPGLTLADGDVTLQIDGAATTDIGDECSETTGGLGWYVWQPTSTLQTTGEVIIINIADLTATAEFDENAVVMTTGGNAAARFSG